MASNSVFSEQLDEKFRKSKFDNLSVEKQNSWKYDFIQKSLDKIFEKKNRILFYCPDIVVVNSLVERIYNLAYNLQKNGYNVIVLHEINNFKCKWLLEEYPEYKDIQTEYIIQKVSKKSKREKSNYKFEHTDTIVVPDVFQEVLENFIKSDGTNLIQKVLFVTGYTGIASLSIGSSYKDLKVNNFIFINDYIKETYQELFGLNDSDCFLLKKKEEILTIKEEDFNNSTEVFPVILVSKIGNDKLFNTALNIFYNKYKNLRFINFKVLERNSIETVEVLLHKSCLFLYLDEDFYIDIILKSIKLGTPVATFSRNELKTVGEDAEEFISFNKDPFQIADFIASYISYWLENSTNKIKTDMFELSKKIEEKYNQVDNSDFIKVMDKLHSDRVGYFLALKEELNKLEVNV